MNVDKDLIGVPPNKAFVINDKLKGEPNDFFSIIDEMRKPPKQCHHDDSDESTLLIVKVQRPRPDDFIYQCQCVCEVCGKHTGWCETKREAKEKGMML